MAPEIHTVPDKFKKISKSTNHRSELTRWSTTFQPCMYKSTRDKCHLKLTPLPDEFKKISTNNPNGSTWSHKKFKLATCNTNGDMDGLTTKQTKKQRTVLFDIDALVMQVVLTGVVPSEGATSHGRREWELRLGRTTAGLYSTRVYSNDIPVLWMSCAANTLHRI